MACHRAEDFSFFSNSHINLQCSTHPWYGPAIQPLLQCISLYILQSLASMHFLLLCFPYSTRKAMSQLLLQLHFPATCTVFFLLTVDKLLTCLILLNNKNGGESMICLNRGHVTYRMLSKHQEFHMKSHYHLFFMLNSHQEISHEITVSVIFF